MAELRIIEHLPRGFTLQEVVGTPFLVLANGDGSGFFTMFDPVDPENVHSYWAELTIQVLSDFHIYRPRPVLHLGGAGMAVARALSSLHPGLRQTVVDIDREITGWIAERFPPGDGVEVIYGDARDWAHLSASHPVVIIDTGCGARDDDEYALYIDLVRRVLASSGPGTTVLVNLTEPIDGSTRGSDMVSAAFNAPVLRFRGTGSSVDNSLVGRAADYQVAALWALNSDQNKRWLYEVVTP